MNSLIASDLKGMERRQHSLLERLRVGRRGEGRAGKADAEAVAGADVAAAGVEAALDVDDAAAGARRPEAAPTGSTLTEPARTEPGPAAPADAADGPGLTGGAAPAPGR